MDLLIAVVFYLIIMGGFVLARPKFIFTEDPEDPENPEKIKINHFAFHIVSLITALFCVFFFGPKFQRDSQEQF